MANTAAYNQYKAMWAITKASLRSITRSPSAVIFGFAFPFIFILVFGFIGNGDGFRSYKIFLDKKADTANPVYVALKNITGVKFIELDEEKNLTLAMQEGKVGGIVNIIKTGDSSLPYKVTLKSTNANNDQWPQIKALLESVVTSVNKKAFPTAPKLADFHFDPNDKNDLQEIREYKTIDFILPGQLGFSLLSAGVFGVAFMFFNLRTTLVLKRFFATPISRTFIILGEALSRVIFQMITAVVIILVGYFFFGFTLIDGFNTLMQMLILSFIGLVVFMGFGFIVSGVAKNESTIPPLANIFTLPQFLLAGTFFSVDVFPKWLQPICRALPLTYLNDALRKVAFEGRNLWDVRLDIAILLLWGVAVYFAAVKVFKWE